MNQSNAVDAELDQPLTVAELLADEVMDGAELIAGNAGLQHPISAVNVMTVPDIARWVRHDEFLLASGYPLPRTTHEQARLLRQLHELGLAGIGIKLDQYLPKL